MAPTLYMIHASPVVRAVLITAKAIGLTLNEKEIEFSYRLTPEYLQLNPQHTVPTLVDDDGFTLWDSHAIMPYLVSKYAKNHDLYPKDLKKRAVIDQRLHFESGIVFARLLRITMPIVMEGKTTIDQADIDNMVETFSFFENFLEGKEYAAGDFLSIADYSLGSTLGSVDNLVPIDAQKFPNVSAWLKKVKGLPEFEANKRGQEDFELLFNAKLGKV